MGRANELTNLTNATVVRTVYRDNKLDYDLMNYDSVSILTEPKDWKKIIGYKFSLGVVNYGPRESVQVTNDTIKVDPARRRSEYSSTPVQSTDYILYTSDSEYFEPEYRGKIISYSVTEGSDPTISTDGDGNPEIEDNPYKGSNGETVLPFTLIPKEYPVDELINTTTGNDLVDLTINIANSYVHLNTLIKYQAWKQGYIISDTDLPDNFNLSPENWLKISASKNGGTTQVGLLDMQADLKSFFQVLTERAALGVAQYGIDADTFLRKSGNPESGFALSIKKEGLSEIRESQLPLYRAAEHDLFEKTRIVYNYHNPNNKISEEGRFVIDFGDVRQTQSQQEEDNHWITTTTNNIQSYYDWIKHVNPDIKTDEEAEKVYNSNRQINNKLGGLVAPVEQPGDVTNES